jgi:ABC-type transport system involved in cytochrome c biogenesis permease component
VTFATSTFLEVMFGVLVVTPIVILWVAAVIDLLRHGGSGVRIAGFLLLILVFPILGPVLYFVFRKPDMTPADAEAALMAQQDLRREAARRPTGGTGVY